MNEYGISIFRIVWDILMKPIAEHRDSEKRNTPGKSQLPFL